MSAETKQEVNEFDQVQQSSNANDNIILKSKEGHQVSVSKKAAMQSKMIKNAVETDTSNDKDKAIEIPLPHIEKAILEKVVKYLEHHENNPPKAIPKPLTSNNLKDFVDEWDASFVETDQDTMFKVLLAANYLDINPLLMLQCAKVASMMRGQTPENIRKIFNIRSDYTPEEEEQVRKEYKDLLE